jgi:hypothetical protein
MSGIGDNVKNVRRDANGNFRIKKREYRKKKN